jgi:purine catabolism regulator
MNYPDYPTLKELLELPVFSGSRLLCGELSLDRPVAGVSLSDIPDYYNWIYPHELLVSTCYAIHDDPAAISCFIQTLDDHGMSGACIKPSRFLGEMPEAMLAAARQLEFPLIELPDQIRFADITKAVSDERLRRQTALLRSSLSVNQMLIQTITAGASLEQIADMVGEITGGSVLLVDSLNRRQAHSVCQRDAARFSGLDNSALNQAILQEADGYEMQVDGHSFGALYLCRADRKPALSEEVLSQILQAIPLEISREHSVRERESRSFSEFFHHLISDRIMDDQWEQSRARTFSLNLSQPHTLLNFRVQMRENAGRYAAIFQRTAFFQALRQQFDSLGLDAHIMSQNGLDLILLEARAGCPPLESSLPHLPSIFRTLQADYPALTVIGGGSRSHAGIPGLSLCRWEAQLALKAAEGRGENCFLRFDQLGILRLLYSGDPHREVGLFVQETLKGLLAPETAHSGELLETLDCYFRNLGNQRRMAQELYVHYNTVAYRLKSIQEITHADLSNPVERMQLELALYLHKFNTL